MTSPARGPFLERSSRARSDHLVGIALGVAFFVLLMATHRPMGISRDESFYWSAARKYAGWFQLFGSEDPAAPSPFSRAAVDRHWKENHEHPALMKTLFAAGDALWFDRSSPPAPGTIGARLGPMLFGLRLPTMLLAGAMVWLLFVVTSRCYGRGAALVAVALWTTLPRPFMHAHIACFDYAATFAWFATVYTLYRAAESSRWAWASGVVFGLAAAIKFNVYFVPPVMFVWWCCAHLRVAPKGTRRTWKVWRNVMITGFSLLVIGQLVFIAHWPWLWFDTVRRFGAYLGFHLGHEYYTIQYLGEMYIRPPFPVTFPVVMTFFTTPLATLAAGLIGIGVVSGQVWRTWPGPEVRAWVARALRRPASPSSSDRGPLDRSGTYARDLLVVTQVAVPMLIIALPNTPIFGGTKHWMAAMPFFCILGGVCVQFLVQSAARWWPGLDHFGRRTVVMAAAAAFLAIPGILGIARNYPYTLSYYNALAGGNQGAVRIGMQRQFWGYATLGALDWVNRNAPEGARLYIHNATHLAFRMYKEEMLLRPDLRLSATVAGSDVALYHVNKIFAEVEYGIWEAYGSNAPVEVLAIDGMPLVNIYARDRSGAASTPRTWAY